MYRYDAFISYKHGGLDQSVAQCLHRVLESYRVPRALVRQGTPRRIQRVFRDQEELAAGDLPAAIQAALERSKFLIVICSPRSRKSIWVQKEVEHFSSLGREADRILLLLTEGEPRTAFPPALEGREHLAADVRSPSAALALRKLKTEKFRLLASVLGCNFDDLRQRHQERHVRRLAGVSLSSLFLVVVFALLTVLVFKFQQDAKREADAALKAEGRANEEAGHAKAEAIRANEAARREGLAKDSEHEARLAAENDRYVALIGAGYLAWENGQVARVLEILADLKPKGPDMPDLRSFDWYYLMGLCQGERQTLRGGEGPIEALAVSGDGKVIATADRTIRTWDAATGQPRGLFVLDEHVISQRGARVLAFSPDAKTLMAWTIGDEVAWWDVASRRLLGRISSVTSVDALAFAPDGQSFAVGRGNTVEIWKLADRSTGSERKLAYKGRNRPSALAFSPDGKRLAAASEPGDFQVWDAGTAESLATFSIGVRDQGLSFIRALTFSPDHQLLAVGADAGASRSEILLFDSTTGKQQILLGEHAEPILSLAFSPDGRWLASGSGDPHYANKREPTVVKLWDVAAKRLRSNLVGHVGRVKAVGFAAEASRLVSASGDGTVKLWDFEAGADRDHLGSRPVGHAVAFGLDGKVLATSGYGGPPKLWDVATGKELHALKGQKGYVNCLVAAPGGKVLTTGSSEGTVGFWDATTGELNSMLIEKGSVGAIAFSPDGQLLATGERIELKGIRTDTTRVRLWEVASGRVLAEFAKHTGTVTAVAFSPDGKLLVSGGADGKVCLIDVATRAMMAVHEWTRDGVMCLAFSPDGKLLSLGGGKEHTVQLRDTEKWELRRTLSGHAGPVHSLAFSADGKLLAAGVSREDRKLPGEVKLWDVATGRERTAVSGHSNGVFSVALTADGRTLAIAYADGTARLWRGAATDEVPRIDAKAPAEPAKDPPSSPKEFQPAKYFEHGSMVKSVAYSADGQRIVTGSDNSVKVWEAASEKEICTYTGHQNFAIMGVAISPDGSKVVSVGGTVGKVWDAATGKDLFELKGHSGGNNCVAFSADGKRIVTGGGFDPVVKEWDAATGNELHSYKGHTKAVNCIAISPDGKLIATGGYDSFGKVWNTATGSMKYTLAAFPGNVVGLAFSPDGRQLVTASQEGLVKVWNMGTGGGVSSFKSPKETFWSMTLSPGGKYAAVGLDRSIRVYEVATGKTVHTFEGTKGVVHGMAITRDGKRMVSGGQEKRIRVWDWPAALIDPAGP